MCVILHEEDCMKYIKYLTSKTTTTTTKILTIIWKRDDHEHLLSNYCGLNEKCPPETHVLKELLLS